MRERPILFNGADVRAILAGQKTQTRRVLKMPHGYWETSPNGLVPIPAGCPFGRPGDRLWVREAHAIFPTHGQHRADSERWGPWGGLPTMLSADRTQIAYFREGFDRCDPGRWRPSIHMPRWACRLVLEITAVRVERLQAISSLDVLAEGVPPLEVLVQPSEFAFRELWTSTGGDWDSNPWVWVIEFNKINEVSNG